MKTADKLFLQLCEEIDYWKNEAKYWEAKYKECNKQLRESYDRQIQSGKDVFGVVLKGVLEQGESVSVDEESQTIKAKLEVKPEIEENE